MVRWNEKFLRVGWMLAVGEVFEMHGNGGGDYNDVGDDIIIWMLIPNAAENV